MLQLALYVKGVVSVSSPYENLEIESGTDSCQCCFEEIDSDGGYYLNSSGDSFCSEGCASKKDYYTCDNDCGKCFKYEEGYVLESGSNFCSESCFENKGFVSCHYCEIPVDKENTGIDLNGMTFCNEICANGSGYYECECCDNFFLESNGKIFNLGGYDNYFCSSKCMKTDGYDFCLSCKCHFKISSESKDSKCLKCVSLRNSKVDSKEIYNSKYNLGNLDNKIYISNKLYFNSIDNNKKIKISDKFKYVKNISFYENVGFEPYCQSKLGAYSYKYNISDKVGFVLINMATVIFVKPDNTIVEICDLSRDVSNGRSRLSNFIDKGNLIELDIFNVLNDDRRSLKTFLKKFKK